MTTRQIRDLLAGHATFRDLPPADIDFVAGCGRNVRFDAGATIMREGEPADTFYVLRAGRAAIEIHLPRGGALTIDTVGPGEVLGWSWLFPPYRWQFDARAIDPVAAVALDGACLRTKCDADPALGYRLMQRFAHVIVEQLQATRLQLLDVYGDGGAR